MLALGTPGLAWVLCAVLVAGLIYGFAGFGAALVYMPVATVFLDPPLAVAAFSLSALISLVTVVPRAWWEADRPATVQLIGFALLGAPIGLIALTTWDPVVLRWCVLAIVALTLVVLIAGWRRRSQETVFSRAVIGLTTGTVGAATGLNGPVLVLFQLASGDAAARTRANTICFLTLNSILLLPVMWVQGVLPPEALWLGAVMLAPYGAGSLIGQALFTPARASLYRIVAYSVIGGAVIAGLPLWT